MCNIFFRIRKIESESAQFPRNWQSLSYNLVKIGRSCSSNLSHWLIYSTRDVPTETRICIEICTELWELNLFSHLWSEGGHGIICFRTTCQFLEFIHWEEHEFGVGLLEYAFAGGVSENCQTLKYHYPRFGMHSTENTNSLLYGTFVHICFRSFHFMSKIPLLVTCHLQLWLIFPWLHILL